MGQRGVTLKYIMRDTDRHGNERVYFRKDGRKVRLREPIGSPAFLEEYSAALVGKKNDGTVKPESLRWLAQRYYVSAAYKTLSPATRKVRQRILDDICMTRGDLPYRLMEPRHVAALRDEKLDTPEAANSRLKTVKALFAWAMLPEVGLADRNPAKDVARIKNPSGGHHTWTVAEVRQYWAAHPLGTKSRLAMDMLLFTGARRSDAVTFGAQMVSDGWLSWVEAKGITRIRKERSIPILPVLRASLDACPSGHLIWLATSHGKPYTAQGFGNWFRECCDAAGLKHCSAHGLRKAGATIAAENGATTQQLMAIWGWESLAEAERYTRKANRKRLAGEAMHLISVPLSEGGAKEAKKP